MNPAVLMTDPRHFAIKGGANPHTRLPDSSLKTVHLDRAWPQWFAYVDALLDAGVDVYVVDAQPDATGMVFAANAGFLPERLVDKPLHEKAFYVSHFTAKHRVVEQGLFETFMHNFGANVTPYSESMHFEGEADAFTIGRDEQTQWLFTYGFRSDPEVLPWLRQGVLPEGTDIIPMRLNNPSYYHGDCLLCDLGGPVLVWPNGIVADDLSVLRQRMGERLVEVGDDVAPTFVGNSFYIETPKGRLLFCPVEVPEATRARIQALGIEVIPVNISEFFGKGGGGPKCMVFNLGSVQKDAPGLTQDARDFRSARDVRTLRENGHFDDVGGWR